MLKDRLEIEDKYKWDLSKMYTEESWNNTLSEVEKKVEEFTLLQGRVADDEEILFRVLNLYEDINMNISGLYAYARMKQDEDTTLSKSQEIVDKIELSVSKFSAKMAFFEPELLQSKYEDILSLITKNKNLEKYRFFLSEIFRRESHTLSKTEEEMLSKLSVVLNSSDDIYSRLSYADMKFENVVDKDGNELELTHGSYLNYISSDDRVLRKDAYEKFYKVYDNNKNTFAATFSATVKKDVLLSEIKKFDSSLDYYLFDDNIPSSVYHNLLKVINNNLHLLQRYFEIKKKQLNLDKLYFYDVYAPFIAESDNKISYEEGVKLVKESLKPLGEEYNKLASEGFESKWIDVYDNKGKRSGAYSYGSYQSMPYILLNYYDSMRDVFTLTHELGHSMHSLYARTTQPYIYSGYSLFTAEVASTVNEGFLANYLINNAKSKKEKLSIINMYLEGFRLTIFRQAMFAEFEFIVHDAVEKGESLTTDYLCKLYADINRKYFGGQVIVDDNIALEWARIPHFYSAFYVYKYATGYSAATAIVEKILNEGDSAVKKYIEFLKSGGSDHAIEILKIAGVDMSTTEPIELAMKKFEKLLDELEKTLNEDE